MKRAFSFLILISLFFTSCKKEEKKFSVVFKVVETGSGTPVYTVRYTLPNGSTQSKGGNTQEIWVSEKIDDYKGGQYLTLSVEGSGGGSYDMYIYINGSLQARRAAGDGFGEQVLGVQIVN